MWKDLVAAKEFFYKFTTMGISEPHPGQNVTTQTLHSCRGVKAVSVWKSAKAKWY